MNNKFTIEIEGTSKEVLINQTYCIGYTGRNIEDTEKHIKELAEIGIAEPPEVPMLYPVRNSSLTQKENIEVLGNKTSGEAEIVILFGDNENEVFITIGSDHTDRALEEVDINLSKQICDKPFAKKAWNLNDIIDHWDALQLSSSVFINGEWIPYQNDKIKMIMSYEDIQSYLKRTNVPMRNSIFFAGTVPLLAEFRYGTKFKMSFKDPVKNDEISMVYQINNIERDV